MLYVILFLIVAFIIYIIATYNGFVKSKNLVSEAFSTMDVYLKKRWDLIPNLVETVKGYATHEKETLEKIVELRNKSYLGLTTDQKIDVNNELSQNISKILAVAENYPDLKANANFMELSKELSGIENDIANSRKYYNGVVRDWNNKVQMFPGNILAGMFGYSTEKMFEIQNEERENVKVQF